jgi:hypothetical protein
MDKYVIVALLRNADKREMADQITKKYKPEIDGSKYIIPGISSAYEAYRIQNEMRYHDLQCRVLNHVWHNVAVYLEEKYSRGR